MSILPWWVNGVAVFMIYSIQVLLIDIQCGNDILIRVIRYVFGRHESNGEMSPVALLVNFLIGCSSMFEFNKIKNISGMLWCLWVLLNLRKNISLSALVLFYNSEFKDTKIVLWVNYKINQSLFGSITWSMLVFWPWVGHVRKKKKRGVW